MKKTSIFGVGAAALLLTVGLVGCGNSLSGRDSELSLSYAEPQTASADSAFGRAESAEMGAGGDANSAIGPKMIVTSDATVIVSNPSQAAEDFRALVQELNGTIDSTWESNTDYDHSSSITVRIPADKFEELTSHLPELGKVQYQNTSSVDVGQEYVDLDARISALEDSLERLQTLADRAESTEELLQAEDMLTSRQAELDSLRQQLNWLDDQVAMSTLFVTFTTEVMYPDDGFSWEHAWDLFMQSVTAFAYLVLVVLPWALLAIVVIAVVRWLLRKRRNRAEPGRPARWVRPIPPSKPEDPSESDKT